jgi:peroxiredoxin Q/BCP
LRDRYAEFQQRGAQVIAIAPDTLENAREFFQGNEIPFPCLPDPDRKVFRQYDVKSAMISWPAPRLFVIDKDASSPRPPRFQQEIPTVDDTRRNSTASRRPKAPRYTGWQTPRLD